VFPFHPVCYEALRRCISLRQPDGEIWGNALYRVFEEANGGRHVRLTLDYGDPDPPAGQVWETLLGQEVGSKLRVIRWGLKELTRPVQILVVNPVDIPELQAEVRDIKSLLRTKVDRRGDDEIKGHAGDDIFSRLPIELRHEIFEYLRPESILALKAASRVMHTTSCPDSLWAAKLVETYPWLWELHDLDVFQSQDLEEKTFQLLRACRENGAYSSKSHSYFLGLANRRRIWGVCEQIRSRYLEKLAV
jgi:hypothetical protein